MERSLLEKAADFMLAQRRHRCWQKVVSGMAAVVVFCTTYALILPAITMSTETVCGLEEHEHTDACWGTELKYPQSTMTCTLESAGTMVVHTHDELCCSEDGTLICTLPELAAHAHTDACCREYSTLVCTETEDRGHTHSDACYTSYRGDMTCTLEETEGHTHNDSCYDVTSQLTCGDESEDHVHDETCYTEVKTLTCTEEEAEGHTHSDRCCAWTRELTCTEEERPAGHIHGTDCYTVATELGCGVDEVIPHTHDESCLDETGAQVCGKEEVLEHQHTADCIAAPVGEPEEIPVLTCGLEEHTHTEICCAEAEPPTEEALVNVQQVIDLIDEMPSADEIDEALAEYEAVEDYEGEEVYYTQVSQQVAAAYYHYAQLTEEEQALVTNADKLMELEYIWSVTTLDLLDTIMVYQVNQYDNSTHTVLVCGGTVQEIIGSTMDFAWWTAVIVEEESDGQLYVSRIILPGEGMTKFSCGAETDSGFVLLVYTNTATVDTQVGDPVTVGFKYQTPTASSAGLGTVNFGDYLKPQKDNTVKLDTVESADTLDLIEVNLYDFGSNINTLYSSNQKYPGFQQDRGTVVTSSTLGASSFNFGNNITSDLAAGIESLTVKDGTTINATAQTYNGTNYGLANIPLEGAISKSLLNGYPALADGTSLDYLFSTGTYATKQNTANINGLFRYNSTTGAYTFNSRENHAQFHASSNTFTLYKQIISSNFIMYPFGNFLPFNDITKLSTQACIIDRSYFLDMADSAWYRYNQGAGDEYLTLCLQLEHFISLMDSKYGTSWDGYDAVNAYFDVRTIPQSFSETSPTMPNGDPLMNYIYSIDYDEATDFFFSMEMKMNFYQPKDGMTGNDNGNNDNPIDSTTNKRSGEPDGMPDYPMEFYFTGDDDVWVYIDDVLFLDLTGIHRHVGGKIDFVNGVVNYYALDISTGDVSTTPYATYTFEEILTAAGASTANLNDKGTFRDYTTHSFSFYYMERGAGSGVCRLNFNFPLLRQNSLSVEKELADDDSTAVVEALGNPDFLFQVLDADDNSLFLPEGWAYALYDADGSVIQETVVSEKYPDGRVKTMTIKDGSGKVLCNEEYDSNGNLTSRTGDGQDKVLRVGDGGIFALKAGQKAEFLGIPETWGKYYVRELLEKTVAGQYGTITVSGTAATMADVTYGGIAYTGADSPVLDMSHGSSTFRIQNKIDTAKLSQLQIHKVLETYARTAQQFEMYVTLDGVPLPVGTPYYDGTEAEGAAPNGKVATEGIVIVSAGATATIPNILAGTEFEVQETSGSAEGYTVTYEYPGADGNTITSAGKAAGTVELSAAVGVVVTNSELGTSVEIPIAKTMSVFGNSSRTYQFKIEEVADQNGTALASPGYAQTTNPLDEPESDYTKYAFAINYTFEDVPLGQTKEFFYKISEVEGTAAVRYDTTYYIVKVVVTNAAGALSAEVTDVWKVAGETTTHTAGTDMTDTTILFTNTILRNLIITKTVVGTDADKATGFEFTVQLTANESNADLPAALVGTKTDASGNTSKVSYDLDENGAAAFMLKDGETVTFTNIPYRSKWAVTETTVEGLSTTYTVTANSATTEYAGNATGETLASAANTTVAFTNTRTYTLPETGGIGTHWYIWGGMALMLASLVCYTILRRKEERTLDV